MSDICQGKFYLRPMVFDDLESVLEMRNHKAIRRYMLTQHKISDKEHKSWFEYALQNPNLDLLVLEIEGKCCGFVQFKKLKYEGVADWGFYIASDAPKGAGRSLGVAALNHVFGKNDNMHKVCGQALDSNYRSINFHKSLGFIQEGVLRDQHFDGVKYCNLICFGVLKKEWLANKLNTGIGK